MQQPNSIQSSPSKAWDEFFEMVSGWTAIWGAVGAVVWLTDYVLNAGGLPRNARWGISGLVLLVTFLVATRMFERLPRLREFVRKWRYPIVLTVVAGLSYQWGAYDSARSDAAISGRAAIWACAKFVECRDMAPKFNINEYIYIPPAAAQ